MPTQQTNPASAPTITKSERAEIYIRAVLRGVTESAFIGLFTGAFGHYAGVGLGASYYSFISPQNTSDKEPIYSKPEVFAVGAKVAIATGAAAGIYSFFHLVRNGIDQGFAQGPHAVQPLKPFKWK